MVHALQQENPQVTHVPRDKVGDDLPPPVGQHFVPAGQPLEDDFDTVGRRAFLDQILVRSVTADGTACIDERTLLLFGQGSEVFELADEA
jgi:hypothetical protein